MTIVGLPDAAVQESRERVRAAIKNSGLPFPAQRVTVNLAPADIRKAGPAYDLPIAIGILLASEQIYGDVEQAIIMGELSLDGGVRHVSGVLSMAHLAQKEGFRTLFVPGEDAAEVPQLVRDCRREEHRVVGIGQRAGPAVAEHVHQAEAGEVSAVGPADQCECPINGSI